MMMTRLPFAVIGGWPSASTTSSPSCTLLAQGRYSMAW
ncbi:Uncharacterised protein [Mycobacteroides abscessus subsp. abscessus]|nr:Uncharacterised protein [Mycobacteroides abscessus subsp. abscessus]